MQNLGNSELRIKNVEVFEIWRAFAREILLHARSAFFIAAAAAFFTPAPLGAGFHTHVSAFFIAASAVQP